MVDFMGHVAMGLLWALPAWGLWHRRTALVFVALTVLTAPVPDVDVWLAAAFPSAVHHHGVTHTVVFALAVSVVAGGVTALLLARPIDRWFGYDRFDARSLFAFATGAYLLGGLSHLFADTLSAPDLAQPIEPFWPFYDVPVGFDLIWYDSPLWNVGLLTAAVVLHLVAAYLATPLQHRFRIRPS